MSADRSAPRRARVERTTRETSILVELDLDGTGQSTIQTGIGFFDHMLELFAHHSLCDLTVQARGDLQVDFHHTVEDTGITLGQALRQALGTKEGVQRYGFFLLPMDEALVRVALDCSGRPFLRYAVPPEFPPMGQFPFQLVEEFLRALSTHAGLTLHVDLLAGRDSHHIAEAIFKGLARALEAAMRFHPRVTGVPSTKGSLDG